MFSFEPKDFKFHVFTDSDGVVYNFADHFKSTTGKWWDEVHPDWAWEQVDKDPEFFSKLPLFDESYAYWEVISQFTPTVLTGCPRQPHFEVAARAKRLAWQRDFKLPIDRIITCMTKDKPKHMLQQGDILIDDHMRNITAWRAAGGTGIFFQSHEQAIEEFIRTVEELAQVA